MKLNEEGLNANLLAQMKQFKCHKVVTAAKIQDLETNEDDGLLAISLEDPQLIAEVPLDFLHRHAPERGGYLVVNEDGYISYSPAEVFEADYHELPLLGTAFGGTPALEPKHLFFAALGNAEKLAFDYAHRLPEGEERAMALQFYQRVRMVTSNGKGGFNAAGYHIDGHHAFAPASPAVDHTEQFAEDLDLSAADFSDALMWLKEGKRVQRAGWNGKGQFVEIWRMEDRLSWPTGPNPSQHVPMKSCFVLVNAQGEAQPGWVPSMGDLMATDWKVV